MAETRAYAPKANKQDKNIAGSWQREDGSTFDLARQLESGGGYIVTDDPAIQLAAEQSNVFKSVPVEEAQNPKPPAEGGKSAPSGGDKE